MSGVPSHHDNDSRIFLVSHMTKERVGNRKRNFKGEFGVNDPAITILNNGNILAESEIEVKSSSMKNKLEGRFLNHRRLRRS